MVVEQHNQRIKRLEEKDAENDKKFERIYERIDETEKKSAEQINRVYASLEQIRSGQHSQELTNQKMDFTLDLINRERDEEKERRKQEQKKSEENMRKIKFWLLGLIGTVITSMVIALLQQWFGL
ncbi:DUF2951 family protein [Abyssicoccus albus]|uniref:DUF2951 family protein n=1 Tax=Abyssicoccus albus TaxID=1817405 RepID=A0A3N5BB32_9BACL|nr:DUF2951 family protein [Abyssicoccus albus]RPF54724.1 DUF2951 family protein [Abyssicoccus albus]